MISSDLSYTIEQDVNPGNILVKYTCQGQSTSLVFECEQLRVGAYNIPDYIALQGARAFAEIARNIELPTTTPSVEELKQDLVGMQRSYTPLEISTIDDLPRVSQVADLTGIVLEILQQQGVISTQPQGFETWPR